MSLIQRLNLTVSLLLLVIFVAVTFNVLSSTVDKVRAEAKSNFELSTRILETKINFIRSIPIEIIQPYPFVEIDVGRKVKLVNFDEFKGIKYINVKLFDDEGSLIATNINEKTDMVLDIPEAIKQWAINELFSDDNKLVRKVETGQMQLGHIEVSENKQAELHDFWYQALSALTPIMILFTFISFAMTFLISAVIKPVVEFIIAVSQQGALDTNNGSVLSRINHLVRLPTHLQGIRHNLQRSNQQVHDLSNRILQLQEEERRRISAELHDELGQHLTAIRFEAEVIRTAKVLEDTRQSAESIDAIGRHMKDIVRSLLERLRPPDLDTLGLQGALSELIAGWKLRHAKAEVYFLCESDFSQFNDDEQLSIYRIVQECLTNISRHAGPGRLNIDVLLIKNKQALTIKVSDDGLGCDLDKKATGFGLIGMKERVDDLQGQLSLKSKPGTGMQISVEIPNKK